MNALARSEAHTKALAAARSVTLALVAGACSSGSLSKPTDQGTVDSDAADTELADTTSSHTGGETDALDTDADDTEVAHTDEPGAKPDCVAQALDIVACCDALRAWCEVEHAGDTDTTDLDACIYGPGYDGSTGCIPWGPPVPPRAAFA